MHRSALFIAAIQLYAIDLRIYSEFQRVDSTGAVVPQDRAVAPREVLSPAVLRNAFASFRVVVMDRPNTLYFLAVQTNPPDVFRIKLYLESAARTLIEERNPSFLSGVTPSTYLLDVWVPADANPGTVRLEVLAKTAYWKVAPMEVRVLPVVVPSLPSCTNLTAARDAGEPSDAIAFRTLFAGLTGSSPGCLPLPVSVLSVVARNAEQDAVLAQTLDARSRLTLLSTIFDALRERARAWFHPRGSESYLAIRQLLQREASAHWARRRR